MQEGVGGSCGRLFGVYGDAKNSERRGSGRAKRDVHACVRGYPCVCNVIFLCCWFDKINSNVHEVKRVDVCL